MHIRPVARFVYGLLGVVSIVAASVVLLLGTGLVPAAVSNFLLEIGGGNDDTMHLIQEYAAFLFVVGVVHLWCARHYDLSLFFHWVLTFFWLFIALIHWFDYKGSFHAGWDRVIDTVPFVVFLLIGFIRHKSERRVL
jgi:hypothetical protein